MSGDAAAMAANKVSGTSLGQFRLKGVAEKIEIHHCRKVSAGPSTQPNLLLAP